MLWWWLGCQWGAEAPVAGAPRPDVILITLDTTRADRIGAYGYARARTDTIDRLAAAGVRFEYAISPLPLTIPSHATMFTGLLPYHHNIRSNGDNALAQDFTTLAERLKGAGWRTAASVAAFVTSREWGFSQGFDAYFDSLPEDGERNFWHTERSGDLVVDDALAWMAAQPPGEPRFVWVHLYDAHFPYKGSYDAELAFVDDQIQRLVEAEAGREVLWALIGDHGEALGEHNEGTHGLWVYNATQRVPWILSGAGVSPEVVAAPVSTADLTPTILARLGLAVPEGLDGKVQPGSAQTPYSESYQLAERFRLAPQRAVVDGRWKLVANPRPELYDIVADPHETTDLAAAHPAEVARLQQILADKGAAPPGRSDQTMDPDTLARLASLGYVSEGGLGEGDPLLLPDPKDWLDVFAALARIETRPPPGGPEGLLELFQSLSARLPQAFELQQRQVGLLMKLERRAEAMETLQKIAAGFPDQPRVWTALASRTAEQGELAAALDFTRKALALDPGNAGAQEMEVQLLFRLGREVEAEVAGLQYMEADPHNYGVAAVLGRWYLGRRQLRDAEIFLRIAVDAANPKVGARVQLAALAEMGGVRADALRMLADEVKEYPANLMARRMMARMLGEDRRYPEQVVHLKYLADQDLDDVDLQRAWAQGMFNAKDYAGARRVVDLLLIQAPEDAAVALLHANLLAKEGRQEEGQREFERAKALKGG